MSIRKQELYCHNCNGYVRFELDTEMNGQHVLKCPKCHHEHYRYVEDGQISDRRWGSANRPMPVYQVPSAMVTYSATSATSDFNMYSWGSDNTTANYQMSGSCTAA